MIDKYIKEVRASSPCDILVDKQAIISLWKLECIRKTFRCKGLNIGEITNLNILPALKVFDVAAPTNDKGIDFMYIEGAEQDECTGQKETFFVTP